MNDTSTSHTLHRGRYLVSALLLAALPLGASAATRSTDKAPVSIASCSIAGTQAYTSMTDLNHAGFATMSISFVDHAAMPATHVAFEVDYDGTRQRIEQTGDFAPGALVEARDVASHLPAVAGSPSCIVERVDFSDGSSWHAAPVTALTMNRRG